MTLTLGSSGLMTSETYYELAVSHLTQLATDRLETIVARGKAA